jgi:phospholipase D1/2
MVMNYQFISIARGENSIYGRLQAEGINPEDYIRFYGLRNYDRIHAAKPNMPLDYEPERDDPIREARKRELAANGQNDLQVPYVDQEIAPSIASSLSDNDRTIVAAPERDHHSKSPFHINFHGHGGAGSSAMGIGVPNTEVDRDLDTSEKHAQKEHVPGNAMPAQDQSLDKAVKYANRQIVSDCQYVTELTYIHCKLMIVDDRIVVCGSGE